MKNMTSLAQIDDHVQTLVASHFKVPADRISADTQFATGLAADSLSVVELMFAVEKTFGVKIPEEVTRDIETVGDLINLLKQFSPTPAA